MRTETYDYVICGAGSAGCVLANRLSADPGLRVLVLEAGPMDRDLMIHIPAGVYAVFTNPGLNWNYETEDEPEVAMSVAKVAMTSVSRVPAISLERTSRPR